jgi:hypothetical protein
MKKPRYRVAEYSAWGAMWKRCTQQSHRHFANYGGRGIKVCERWSDFWAFYADMGPRPTAAHTIERSDGDGDYEPHNCYWATRKQQNNNRKNNVFVEHGGRRMTLAQWADELGISYPTLWNRYRAGLTADQILAAKKKGVITHNGVTGSIGFWSEKTGIEVRTISQRLWRYRWSVEDALTIPAALGNKIKFLKQNS